MLEARELTRKYGDHLALHRLNLTIRPGEIFCLLGANGAGKTTTINLFLNFIDPSSGAAFVDGMNVVDHALDCRKRIAYIPETVMLYKNLTGLENLRFFAEIATGTSFPKDELRIYLKRSGLHEQAFEKRISSYSKGMRQKVGIAVALAKSAKALLLDEPTSGLDPKASNEFSKLLCEMSESGVAVLMATHDLFRAKESGTRLGIMRNGVLSMECSTKEVSHSDLERIYLECMDG
jgi:ABC-2 type transport system ATP-binding protein